MFFSHYLFRHNLKCDQYVPFLSRPRLHHPHTAGQEMMMIANLAAYRSSVGAPDGVRVPISDGWPSQGGN